MEVSSGELLARRCIASSNKEQHISLMGAQEGHVESLG
jgi:hypothetical protein